MVTATTQNNVLTVDIQKQLNKHLYKEMPMKEKFADYAKK